MRIAAFYSDNPFAGWVQTEGFVDVLKRMGHEVVGIPVPCRGRPISKADTERINKPIDDCELVIVSGPEWLTKWIRTFYKDWDKLKVPKVGWYHESFVRDDFKLDYAEYENMFDFHFFPDPKDAEKYKGTFLPLGVDTEIFYPREETLLGDKNPRVIPAAFIGLMYPKRANFFAKVKEHLGDIEVQARFATRNENGWWHPAIAVYDFGGLNVRLSMTLLARVYSSIKVFVTFPSMSNVLVAKVLESLACGCRLVAPRQPVNLDGHYFPYETPKECADQIRAALEETEDKCAFKYIVGNHRMQLRFEQIFAKVGICASV